jgi:hypothetical protein
MRRLTYDGFDPVELGFKRFRDFLTAAQAAGVVVIRERPGDVEVVLPGLDAGPGADARTRVRRDIWRSFVDWNPEALHFLDLRDGRAVEIPRRPVELEPARFADIRARVEAGDEQLVRIPSIPVGEQTQWMRLFCQEVPDEALKKLLLGALADDKPAKSFTSIVRADSSQQHQWNLFFGQRVLSAVKAWLHSDPRLSTLEVFDSEPARDGSALDQGADYMSPATRDFIDAASRLVDSSRAFRSHTPDRRAERTAGGTTAEARLRNLIHRAVDRMSEDELRALRIPAGTLVDDV